MKKATCLSLLLCAVLLSSCAGSKKVPKRPDAAALAESGTPAQLAAPQEGAPIAIFTTSEGEIRAVLFPEEAPMAVYNFAGLARTDYYTGTDFTRAQYGFVLQGGDATGTGSGGSTIWSNNPYPLEATADLRHYAGALCAAFATGGEKEGGTGQFYFVAALPDSVNDAQQEALTQNGYSEEEIAAYAKLGGLPYLDNTDTVFGQVYAGMEVVDKINAAETDKTEDGADTYHLTTPVTIEKITIATYPGPTAEDLAAEDGSGASGS